MYKAKGIYSREKGFTMMSRLGNLLLKNGKRGKSHKFISQCLKVIKAETGNIPLGYIEEAVDLLRPIGKLKKMVVLKNQILIPCPMNKKQSEDFALRVLIQSVKERSEHSFGEALGKEILDIHKGRGISIKFVNELNKSIMENRTYLYYGNFR